MQSSKTLHSYLVSLCCLQLKSCLEEQGYPVSQGSLAVVIGQLDGPLQGLGLRQLTGSLQSLL